MDFETKLKKWIDLDIKHKTLNEQIKLVRNQKNELENSILHIARENKLENKILDINEQKIKCVNSNIAEPLTFRYLEKTLPTIIKNEEQVQQIIQMLKIKREIKIVPEIKRYFNNKKI